MWVPISSITAVTNTARGFREIRKNKKYFVVSKIKHKD